MKKVFKSKVHDKLQKYPFQFDVSDFVQSKELTDYENVQSESLTEAGTWKNLLIKQKYNRIEEKIENQINLKNLQFIGKSKLRFTRKELFINSKKYLFPFILKIILLKYLIINSNETERKTFFLDSFFENFKIKNKKEFEMNIQEMDNSNSSNLNLNLNNKLKELLSSNELVKLYELINLTLSIETICEVKEYNIILNYFVPYCQLFPVQFKVLFSTESEIHKISKGPFLFKLKLYIDLTENYIYQIFEIPKVVEKLKPQNESPLIANRSFLEFLSILTNFLYESTQVDLEHYREIFLNMTSKIFENISDPVGRSSLVGGLRDQVSRYHKYNTEEKKTTCKKCNSNKNLLIHLPCENSPSICINCRKKFWNSVYFYMKINLSCLICDANTNDPNHQNILKELKNLKIIDIPNCVLCEKEDNPPNLINACGEKNHFFHLLCISNRMDLLRNNNKHIDELICPLCKKPIKDELAKQANLEAYQKLKFLNDIHQCQIQGPCLPGPRILVKNQSLDKAKKASYCSHHYNYQCLKAYVQRKSYTNCPVRGCDCPLAHHLLRQFNNV